MWVPAVPRTPPPPTVHFQSPAPQLPKTAPFALVCCLDPERAFGRLRLHCWYLFYFLGIYWFSKGRVQSVLPVATAAGFGPGCSWGSTGVSMGLQGPTREGRRVLLLGLVGDLGTQGR